MDLNRNVLGIKFENLQIKLTLPIDLYHEMKLGIDECHHQTMPSLHLLFPLSSPEVLYLIVHPKINIAKQNLKITFITPIPYHFVEVIYSLRNILFDDFP